MTLARCISRTFEGNGVPPPESASNNKQCGAIAGVVVALIALVPVVYSGSIVDSEIAADGAGWFRSGGFGGGGGGGGGYGYGGCGGWDSSTPARCHLATEVQYWDCSGCSSSPAIGAPEGVAASTDGGDGRLRTIGAGGSAPDAEVSRVVADWLWDSADRPEPGEHEGNSH
jgi:hypothetical protein